MKTNQRGNITHDCYPLNDWVDFVQLGKYDCGGHTAGISQYGTAMWSMWKELSPGSFRFGNTFSNGSYNNVTYGRKNWLDMCGWYCPYNNLYNCETGENIDLLRYHTVASSNTGGNAQACPSDIGEPNEAIGEETTLYRTLASNLFTQNFNACMEATKNGDQISSDRYQIILNPLTEGGKLIFRMNNATFKGKVYLYAKTDEGNTLKSEIYSFNVGDNVNVEYCTGGGPLGRICGKCKVMYIRVRSDNRLTSPAMYTFSVEHTDVNPCNVRFFSPSPALSLRSPLSISPSRTTICIGQTAHFQISGGSGSYLVQIPETNQTYPITSSQTLNLTATFSQTMRVYDVGGDCDNSLSIDVPVTVKTDCEPAPKPNLITEFSEFEYVRQYPCAPFDTMYIPYMVRNMSNQTRVNDFFYNRVYLSKKNFIDNTAIEFTDDILVANSGMPAGGVALGRVMVKPNNLPSDMRFGCNPCYVIMQTDVANWINEYNEYDNTTVGKFYGVFEPPYGDFKEIKKPTLIDSIAILSVRYGVDSGLLPIRLQISKFNGSTLFQDTVINDRNAHTFLLPGFGWHYIKSTDARGCWLSYRPQYVRPTTSTQSVEQKPNMVFFGDSQNFSARFGAEIQKPRLYLYDMLGRMVYMDNFLVADKIHNPTGVSGSVYVIVVIDEKNQKWTQKITITR